jgi:hypothetical protein
MARTIRMLWLAVITVIAYFYSRIGAFFAIATAFYWLLETPPQESPKERLFCARGNHYIGNEPYSFLSNGDARCARCQKEFEEFVHQELRDHEEQNQKEMEWNNFTEEQREERRQKYLPDFCPKCERRLKRYDNDGTAKTYPSCPLCFEFPNNPGAPMHRVKRIMDWAMMGDEERRRREAECIALRERNLSEWATRGEDGQWHRKDNGKPVDEVVWE